MTMMATPAIAPDMDPNISAVGKIAIVFLTSDALDISNSFSVPTFEVSDEMHLKSALVFTTKVNILRPADGQMRNGKKIVDGLVKSLQAKNVIILHLNYPTSVAVAQDLIAELQAKGYAFVSLSELND